MKVLALLAYPLDSAPGQRYRIEQWAPYLAAYGIDITLRPFADHELIGTLHKSGRYPRKVAGLLRAWTARIQEAWTSTGFDAVYVQREASLIGPAIAERLALKRCKALFYDFDDAVYLPYVSPTNRYFSYLKFPGKTRALCRLASAVLAGNALLADYARRYNSNVHVVPSTVSLREYGARPRERRAAMPVIGWTGSHSSVQYLSIVSGALQRLREKMAFRMLIIGVQGVTFPGIETECRPWNSATEVRDLWDMDIGIMPLSDDLWSRGKCGMKAVQYMGVGIPPVVSPVGVNRQIVTHGFDGFHATGEEEWVEGLSRLLSDPALRRRMGAAAGQTVADRYSAEAHVPNVARILQGVCP